MTRDFQVSFLLYKKWSNLIVLPLSIVLLLVAVIFSGAWLYVIALLLLFSAVSVNFLWFVPTGFTGYKTRFTKLVKKARPEGINFLIPVIEDGKLFSIRETAYEMHDVRKVLGRNDLETDMTLYLRLMSEYVPTVFRVWGENYYKDIVEPLVDATIDTFIGKLTYPQFQTQKQEIEKIISALVKQELDHKCSEASAGLGRHTAYRCKYSADVTKAIDLDEDGTTEEIPQLEFNDWTEEADGVMFFDICMVKLNKVRFEKDYEDAMGKVAVAKAQAKEAKFQVTRDVTKAEGLKKVKILQAEAQAKAIDMQGEALRKNPEYTAQTRAEHMPTTVAGDGAVSVLVGGK